MGHRRHGATKMNVISFTGISRILRRRGGRHNGFIVVAVLWLVAALATLAGIYSLYVREAAGAFAGRDDRIFAHALVQAGVELAVQQMTAIPDQRPAQGRRQPFGSVAPTLRSIFVRRTGASTSMAPRRRSWPGCLPAWGHDARMPRVSPRASLPGGRRQPRARLTTKRRSIASPASPTVPAAAFSNTSTSSPWCTACPPSWSTALCRI